MTWNLLRTRSYYITSAAWLCLLLLLGGSSSPSSWPLLSSSSGGGVGIIMVHAADDGGAAAATTTATRNADTTHPQQKKKKRKSSSLLMQPPIIVGDLQPIQYVDKTTPLLLDAAQIRLPWTVTSVIGDYCMNSGICTFFRDEILANKEEEEDHDYDDKPLLGGESLSTEDNGKWYLQRPSSSDNNFHFMYSEDEPTHTKLLSILAKSGFNPVLESLGKYLGWDTINIYSMGFVGASHAEPSPIATDDGARMMIQPLNSHLMKSNNNNSSKEEHTGTATTPRSRSFQLLIPMTLKLGSRPEFQIPFGDDGDSDSTATIKLRSEMDVGWLLGDSTAYGPSKFDYRDSPGEMNLAFTVYLTNVTTTTATPDSNSNIIADEDMIHLPKQVQRQVRGGHVHWKKDGSVRLEQVAKMLKESCVAENCDEPPVHAAAQQQHDDDQQEFDEEMGNFGPYHYLWSNWSFHEFKDNLECSSYYNSNRGPPTEAYWKTLRQMYISIVGESNSTLDLPLSSDHDSFHVQVESKISPGKGRGIFAKEFIPRGTLVYHPKQQARFTDGYLYKKLLMAVSVEAACDLLMWSSIQKVVLDGVEQPPMIVVDLDNGALVNSGIRTENLTAEEIAENEGELANTGCMPEFANNLPNGCSEYDFALTDIQIGEELLIDYEEYSNLENAVWVKFGLANVGDDEDDEEYDDEGFDDLDHYDDQGDNADGEFYDQAVLDIK